MGRRDEGMAELEISLVLHDLAKILPRREMNIILMRAHGERMHDIAKAEHMPFRDINRLLDSLYELVAREIWGETEF